jgi:anti-sigma regulatory factor (Ser/Thr protein kinase)
MTPHSVTPAVVPPAAARHAPSSAGTPGPGLSQGLPVGLASVVLACGSGERWFAARGLGPGLDSPRTAREFTQATLRAWDLSKVAEDASVIVSELVTNALRHGLPRRPGGAGPDPVELFFWQCGGLLFCAVTDPAADPPVPAEPGPFAEAGRGLHVIDALASAWGWGMLDACRKAVWATLRVPGPDAAV